MRVSPPVRAQLALTEQKLGPAGALERVHAADARISDRLGRSPPGLANAAKVLTDHVQARIRKMFEDSGVELPQADFDFSAEATATRIIDGISGMYAGFAQRHAERGGEERVEGFMSIVRKAVEEGFAAASEMLDAMSLSDEVRELGQDTMELTRERLDDLEDELHERETPSESGGVNDLA